MRIIFFKKVLVILVVGFFLSIKTAAANNCVVNVPSVVLPSTILKVASDAPVGAKLGSVNFNSSSSAPFFVCNTSTLSDYYIVNDSAIEMKTIGNTHIYNTGVQGLGYSLGASIDDRDNSCSNHNFEWVGNASTYNNVPASIFLCKTAGFSFGSKFGTSSNIKIDFYKIAKISGNPVNFNIAFIGNSNASQRIPIHVDLTFKMLQCKYSGGNKTVPLGDVKANDFYGTGAISKGENDFSLSLNCDQSTPVSLELDGKTPAYGGIKSVLETIKEAGSASGVGVQVLYKNNGNYSLFPLNKVVSLGTYSGQTQLDFAAQYYALNDTVTPGNVKATATFTFTYQ